MILLDQRSVGIAILILLALLVFVKQMATGTVLDRPAGALPVWLADVYNLIFLLIVNPLAAILLITRRFEAPDATALAVQSRGMLMALEVGGMLLYVTGWLLMAWALIVMGRRFQAGGRAPRAADSLVVSGPYRLVRHPMFSAVLFLALGLACLLRSPIGFAVFAIYVLLIVVLIPIEEQGMTRAYGEEYTAYQRGVSRLIPHLY